MSEVIRSQYRIPVVLVDWLKNKALSNSRSLNGQLIETIKEAKNSEESKKAGASRQ